MGVKGLWTLLEPVGRRIDIEAISNKRLAVDASIWLFQFMRAMRNSEGEMIKNAHLLGFFRRICRLLFHKVQPIFVFEGTTPALKRATTAARRARREHHSAALKRAAEKLLVNQIKRQALLEAQRQREQQQQQRRQGVTGSAAADPDEGAAGSSRKRCKASPAAEASAAAGSSAAVAAAAAGAAEAEAGPSSKHQQLLENIAGTDAEDLLLAAALEASAAAAADPKGKQPASSVGTNLPQHVLRLLQDTEQQYDTKGLPGDPEELTDSMRHRLAQEEADAELAMQLDQEINRRADDDLTAAAAAAASDGHDTDDEAVLQYGSGSRRRSKIQQPTQDCDDDDKSQQLRPRRARPAAAQEQQQLLRAIAVKRQQQQRRAAADWEPDDEYETAAAAVAGEDKFTKLLNLKGPEFVGGAAAAAGSNDSDMGSDDDDDGAAANFLLPSDVSNLDPAVLSTLPQSVQLDILEKMRDAQQAANRDKFIQAAAAPQTFSQIQMETYLRASRFKQQIERHKKALGAAQGGPQEPGEQIRGRHMASEHTREFIFAKQNQSTAVNSNPDIKPHISNTVPAASGGFMPSATAAGGKPSSAATGQRFPDKQPAGGSPIRRFGGKRKRKFEKYLDDLQAAESSRPPGGFRPDMMPAGSLDGVKGLAAFSSVLRQWEGMNQRQQQQGEEEVQEGLMNTSAAAVAAAVPVKQEPGIASAVRTSQIAAAAAAAASQPSAADVVQQPGSTKPGSGPAEPIAVNIDLCVESDDEGMFAGLGDSSSEDGDHDTAAEPAGAGKHPATPSAAAVRGADGIDTHKQHQNTAAAAADANDSEDWEDVDVAVDAPPSQQQQQQSQDHDQSQQQEQQQEQQQQPNEDDADKALPAWRQRMAVRHKFWSSSHGFKLGRKLGDWAVAEKITHAAPAAAAALGGSAGSGSLGGLESAAAAAGGVVAAVVSGALHRSPVKPLVRSRAARRLLNADGSSAAAAAGGGDGVDLTVESDEEYDADVQQAIQLSLAEAAGAAAGVDTAAVSEKAAGGGVVMVADIAEEDWEDVDELTALAAATAAPAAAAAAQAGITVTDAAFHNAHCQQQQQKQQEPVPSSAQHNAHHGVLQEHDTSSNLAAVTVGSRNHHPVSALPTTVGLAASINASSSRRLEQHPSVAPRDATAVVAMHRDLMAAAQQTSGSGERAETAAARAEEAAAGQYEPVDSQEELMLLSEVTTAAEAAEAAEVIEYAVAVSKTDDAHPTPRGASSSATIPPAADVDDVEQQQQQQGSPSFDFSFMQEPVLRPAKTPPPTAAAASSVAIRNRTRLKQGGGAAAGSTGKNKLPLRVGPFVSQQQAAARSDVKEASAQDLGDPAVLGEVPEKEAMQQQTQQQGQQQEQQQEQQPQQQGQQQQQQPQQQQQLVSDQGASSFGDVQLPVLDRRVKQSTATAQQLPQSQLSTPHKQQPEDREQPFKQQQQQQQQQQQRIEQSVSSQVLQQEPAGPQSQAAQPVDIDAQLAALEEEHRQLKSSVAAASRNTATPTQEMIQECQELLTLFGVPFIIAPAEAEAQCAWLEAAGLVDGVVTDDNDAFLFGSQHVYRHLFEDKKYVEEYHMSDITSELGVERDQLVCLALLLGSDYTEGVQGIGVVNALEVVSAWPGGLSGLQKFKQWLEGPDERLVAAAKRAAGATTNQRKSRNKAPKQDSSQPDDSKAEAESASRGDGQEAETCEESAQQQGNSVRGGRRGRKSAGVRVGARGARGRGRGARAGSRKAAAADTDAAGDEDDVDDVQVVVDIEEGRAQQQQKLPPAAAPEEESKAQQNFKRAHKGVRRSWQLPVSFPNARVAEAYTAPLVDRNPGKFIFGKPDTSLLQAFCRERFGWDQTKIDELLLPVLRSYSERSTQLRMDQFLTHKQRFAKVRSKRLQKAITAITGVEVNPDLFYAEVRHLPELLSYQGTDEGEQQASKEGRAAAEQMVQAEQDTCGKSVKGSTLQLQPPPSSRLRNDRASHNQGAAAGRALQEPSLDAGDDMGSAQSDLAFARLMQTAAD